MDPPPAAAAWSPQVPLLPPAPEPVRDGRLRLCLWFLSCCGLLACCCPPMSEPVPPPL
uniref:Cysteine-rich transmembrane CYSTM domain-containing protein n=1 Tax=Setaria viridis TaxID=4556 RepID=A0A4U6U5J6_SETVI|nr:hypothetical protein SEVIR_7G178600v2 [Setaria viridis]